MENARQLRISMLCHHQIRLTSREGTILDFVCILCCSVFTSDVQYVSLATLVAGTMERKALRQADLFARSRFCQFRSSQLLAQFGSTHTQRAQVCISIKRL